MKQPSSLNDVITPRELILFGVILVIAFVATFNVVLRPKLVKQAQLGVQVHALEAERAAIHKFQEVMRNRAPGQDPLLTPLDNAHLQILSGVRAPELPDLNHLVGTITAENFLRGLRLESIEYDPIQHNPDYLHSTIRVKASGNYREVVEYLARLEHLEILLHLKKFSLGLQNKGTNDITIEWEADYYQMKGDDHAV